MTPGGHRFCGICGKRLNCHQTTFCSTKCMIAHRKSPKGRKESREAVLRYLEWVDGA